MKACDIEVGMKLEARQPTGKWYPIEVLRRVVQRSLLPSTDPMFWGRVTYPNKATAEVLRVASEMRPEPTRENR